MQGQQRTRGDATAVSGFRLFASRARGREVERADRRIESLVVPLPTTRSVVLPACARGVAALALLYLLNAFAQSGWINLPELIAGVLWVCGCFAVSRWLGAWGIVGLSFAASLLWAFLVGSQPASDFLDFHQYAGEVVATGNLLSLLCSKSPLTVAYYAVFHAILGSFHWTNYVAGAFAWSAGSLLIYRALSPWVADARRARFVCACLALYPSFVVFAVVPSSEAVTFLLTGTCAWLLSVAVRRCGTLRTGYAALAGLTVAALYLVRMNGLILVVPCLVLLGLRVQHEAAPCRFDEACSTRLFAPVAPLIVFVALLTVAVTAFGGLHAVKSGEFRIRPSPWSELVFLFGTNMETNGGYNKEDIEAAGYPSDDPEIQEAAPDVAREMALNRIRSEPARFVMFALTTKMEGLWERERALNNWSIGDAKARNEANYYLRRAAILGADGAYRVVFVLFLVALAGQVRRPTHAAMLGGIVLLYALPHLLIEVKARYHVPMITFMIVGVCVYCDRVAPLVVSVIRRREVGGSQVRRWHSRVLALMR